MANNKCKGCGQYKPLIGDYCAECRCTRAYELNQMAAKIVDEIVDDSEYVGVDQRGMDCFNSLRVEQFNKQKEIAEKEFTYDEAFEEIYSRILEANGIPQESARKYKPQLVYLIKKYMFHLAGGSFFLTDKDSYRDNHIGCVVDVKGRWVVYRIEPMAPDGITVELRPEVKELIGNIENYIKEAKLREETETNEGDID